MKKVLFSAAILIFSFSGGANIFVGNPGEGVEIDGRLYLLDLVTLGLQTDPYFGPETDSELPALPTHKTIRFPYPEALLARKLSDLNRAAPGIGDFLLASMKLYTWTLVDAPLTPIGTANETIQLPPGTKFIQLANRLGTVIRIHSQSWRRLDDKNKVALLIHEAVYSLVRVSPLGDRTFFQSEHEAQEITASFFDPSFFFREASEIFSDLRNKLNIPDVMLPLASVREEPTWRFSLMQTHDGVRLPCNGVGALCSHAGTVVDFKARKQSYNLLAHTVTSLCYRLESASRVNKNYLYSLSSVFTPRPLKIEIKQYQASLRTDVPFQTYVSVSQQAQNPSTLEYALGEVDKCIAAFTEHLNAAASSLW